MAASDTAPELDRWELFERCRPRLSRVARRILGCAAEAEDLVQETSVRWLLCDPAQLRAPEGWLVAVIARLSVDRLRRRARELPLERAPHGPSEPRAASAPDLPLELDADLCAAFSVLCALEPAARRAFVLRDLFACSYDQIARLLAKRATTCRQIVHRARKQLRRCTAKSSPRALTASRGQSSGTRAAACFLEALANDDHDAALAAMN